MCSVVISVYCFGPELDDSYFLLAQRGCLLVLAVFNECCFKNTLTCTWNFVINLSFAGSLHSQNVIWGSFLEFHNFLAFLTSTFRWPNCRLLFYLNLHNVKLLGWDFKLCFIRWKFIVLNWQHLWSWNTVGYY